ncbi:uncharacterized protein Dvar_32710 [Desulfosarcina variabilis str. Montpellier]
MLILIGCWEICCVYSQMNLWQFVDHHKIFSQPDSVKRAKILSASHYLTKSTERLLYDIDYFNFGRVASRFLHIYGCNL